MGVATTCILLNRVSFFDVTRRPRLFAWHGFYSTRIGSPGWSHLHIICMMRVTTARFSEDSAQFSDEDSNYGNCASRARFHSLIRLYLQPLYLGAERGQRFPRRRREKIWLRNPPGKSLNIANGNGLQCFLYKRRLRPRRYPESAPMVPTAGPTSNHGPWILLDSQRGRTRSNISVWSLSVMVGRVIQRAGLN